MSDWKQVVITNGRRNDAPPPHGFMTDFRITTGVARGRWRTVRRTWRERLFTLPWRPWVATKLVEAPFPPAFPGKP